MSSFSSVDDSPDPAALVAYLDAAAAGLTAMKHYVAAAARRAVGHGIVLDVGCGAGHDLALLDEAGLEPIGLDASVTMLETTRERAGGCPPRLVRAFAQAMPFRSGGLDGCRLERVLVHVESAEAVLAEVARVVRPGGFLAMFEPDWASLRFGGGDPDDVTVARGIVGVRQPDIGARLHALAESAGFRVLDRVTEVSFGGRIGEFPLVLDAAIRRAVGAGRIDRSVGARWLARQDELDRAGRFRASWTKVLVIAERR